MSQPSADPVCSTPPTSFGGREELIERLDTAVELGDEERITRAIQSTLTEMIQGGRLSLPEPCRRLASDTYARHLLCDSEQHDWVAVAMVWGPGQGTALHDHDGVWCVEGVVEGEIAVVRYEPVEREGERWRFRPSETVSAAVGSSGSLIPPFEFHTITNRQSEARAITLHVYGRELQKAHIFEPVGEEWFERRVRQLGYAA